MGFSPNNIKTIFNRLGEPQKACYYNCIITPPIAMLGLLGGGLGNILTGALLATGSTVVTMLASDVMLPASTLTTTPFTMNGIGHKVPYGRMYQDLSVSFICTRSMAERYFFDYWHGFIHSPHDSNYMNYYDDYVGTILFKPRSDDLSIDDLLNPVSAIQTMASDIASGQLGRSGNTAAGVLFHEVWPTTIGAQTYSYGDSGFVKLSVDFAYLKSTNTMDNLM